MANYYASNRTNYFRVNDKDAFLADMEKVPDISIQSKDDCFVILGDSSDAAGWPCSSYNEETDDYEDIDLPLLVSQHLADEEVAVFMECGAEKLRYLIGYSEAINAKGERRQVSLDDIYSLARELGSNVTEATY